MNRHQHTQTKPDRVRRQVMKERREVPVVGVFAVVLGEKFTHFDFIVQRL